MASSGKIPQFFVNFIGTLYRSIAWAFGKDLPRPLGSRNFCPYFWAVFFTFLVPIGLLPVLIGWTLRLALGKGRGGAIARKLKKPLVIAVNTVLIMIVAAVVVGFLVLTGIWIYEHGIIAGLFVVLKTIAEVAAFLIFCILVALFVSLVCKPLFRWVARKFHRADVELVATTNEKPKAHSALKRITKVGGPLFFVLAFFFRVVLSVVYAFWLAALQGWGLAYKGYKTSCPIAAFP